MNRILVAGLLLLSLAEGASAALSKDEQKCFDVIARGVRTTFVKAYKALTACHDRVRKGKLLPSTDCSASTPVRDVVASASDKIRERVEKACSLDRLAELGFPSDRCVEPTPIGVSTCVSSLAAQAARERSLLAYGEPVALPADLQGCARAIDQQQKRVFAAELKALTRCRRDGLLEKKPKALVCRSALSHAAVVERLQRKCTDEQIGALRSIHDDGGTGASHSCGGSLGSVTDCLIRQAALPAGPHHLLNAVLPPVAACVGLPAGARCRDQGQSGVCLSRFCIEQDAVPDATNALRFLESLEAYFNTGELPAELEVYFTEMASELGKSAIRALASEEIQIGEIPSPKVSQLLAKLAGHPFLLDFTAAPVDAAARSARLDSANQASVCASIADCEERVLCEFSELIDQAARVRSTCEDIVAGNPVPPLPPIIIRGKRVSLPPVVELTGASCFLVFVDISEAAHVHRSQGLEACECAARCERVFDGSKCTVGICLPSLDPSAEPCVEVEKCAPGAGCNPATGECGPYCGDGTTNQAGEQCDDGGESVACDLDCTFAECGDRTTNTTRGEECDAGGESGSCDADCTLAVCGDGTRNDTRGEECDDGGESFGCDSNCTIAFCGDEAVNETRGEECEEQLDLCPLFGLECGPGCVCEEDTCGNGVIDPGEECDPQLDLCPFGFQCGADCVCEEDACGNGIIDPGEECDPGVIGPGIPGEVEPCQCTLNCTCAPFCGDGVVNQAEEECDGPDDVACPGACNSLCACNVCGDGVLGGAEECDPPENFQCPGSCKADCSCGPVCGNNRREDGEECDGADAAACENGCSTNCTCRSCGNGIVDPGEQCDGDSSSCPRPEDSCNSECLCEPDGCGNGIVEPTETCDHGGSTETCCGSNCRFRKPEGTECDDMLACTSDTKCGGRQSGGVDRRGKCVASFSSPGSFNHGLCAGVQGEQQCRVGACVGELFDGFDANGCIPDARFAEPGAPCDAQCLPGFKSECVELNPGNSNRSVECRCILG